MKNSIYTFKVSVDKEIFRTIEIKGGKSLYDLASLILKSFDFRMDHAFGFYSNIENIHKSDDCYELFADMDDPEPGNKAKSVEKTAIHAVFQVGKKMLFLFDYGDEWFFLVECKNILDPAPKVRYPRIIERVGESPEQYPDDDE